MKKAAIVILNYNGRQVLPTFLPSVLLHSRHDCWVVDNASTDDSVDFLKSAYPSVQRIQLDANFGYAGGYNWGLEELKGRYEYFILLNSDVEVTAGWDADLVSWLDQNPGHAALQPKILSWQDRRSFDYAGAGGGYLDHLGYPYCRGRIWETIEQDRGQYDDSVEVDWASGACLAIRSVDFFSQGGFDAHFFAHMEEIDLCWRLRSAGRKIGYLGLVTVFHQGGATLDRGNARKLYLNIRNSLRMVYKNVAAIRFFGIVVAKSFLEIAAALGYLFRGKRDFARAVWQAYVDFFTGMGAMEKATKKPEMEKSSSGPVRFIFWNYLVLGKRVFTKL
ncbi:glycosyltransferase family 2 protein [Algoriphagus sp. H41]|uniref:Glycosyltransferase family 2 protein n=1 Tax=Algoriphagus oliviformis TaxID=2811231 RepID=A0ABS3CAS2_9BACT|nr:glycosyltransferase family 2 protein [Algoriphagus oliviformis]MBN7812724.1 glycosyltransferase family 2 protein [Algoriphagus oliviformis]